MSKAWTSSSGESCANCATLSRSGKSHLGIESVRAKPGVVEIIAPAKRRGQPLAEPSMEAERRQLQPVDGRDKRLFLALSDERLGLRHACEDGSFKQVGLRSEHVRSH